MVDAPAYLDCVYVDRILNEGDTLDLGYQILYASDLDKSGLIDITDVAMMAGSFGLTVSDTNYNIN
ncbi:MAG: hypothetical protein K2H53_02645, partial [Clostridia bacterium]|nr:hypothetical protein [Clostridia bacterium]